MVYIHKGYNGKIGIAKRNSREIQEIHVYTNSSDFPGYNIIVLCDTNKKLGTERVPINEDLWQIIGECFGYKFRKIKNKDIAENCCKEVE